MRKLLAASMLVATMVALPSQPVGGQVASRPNVILVVVDDMRWDEAGVPTSLTETFPVNYLPTIGSLVDDGFYASNAFVVNSLCCPSRASILTGNYSHTTGVWNNQNQLGRGGFASFRPNEGSTLATWFDAAGYRTALVGKYLNGYNKATYIPDGWDRWAAFIQSTIGPYNYKLSVDGAIRSYRSAPADYSTDVLAGHATEFIRSTNAVTPLFLFFTPYSPHAPYTPAPRHAGMFSSYAPVMPPNVAEADVSDKPTWVRKLAKKGTGWKGTKRKQMEMLMSVDDALAAMLDALEETGRGNDTIVIFTSDNGMSGGSHRWGPKKSPWDEALRTPFIAMGPGIDPGTHSSEMVLNVDIAETLQSLTGVSMPATEGESVASLLASGTAPVHEDFVFEHLVDTAAPPTYCGVRTSTHKYIRYADGQEELYDLVADPWELESRHDAPAFAGLKAELLARTRQLCDPAPPGYSF
jgi:arylsulfatase A-like enzyme